MSTAINIICAVLLTNWASSVAYAQAPLPPAPVCIEDAATAHGVNVMLIRAIIWHESLNTSNLVLRNDNGSIDVGLGGINSIHFPELAKHGIQPKDLLDPCVNSYVVAWHLAKQQRVYGNSWLAVGAYHSRTPNLSIAYARKIKAVLVEWGQIETPQD